MQIKALKLIQVENNDAVRRDLGGNLQVRSGPKIVLSRFLGRRQPFFKHILYSLQRCVQSSNVKQRRALKLRGGKDLRVNEAWRGKNSRGPTSRWASKRRGSFMRLGAFVQKDYTSFCPRALAGCRCRMRPRGEGIGVLAGWHRTLNHSVGAVSAIGPTRSGRGPEDGCRNAEPAECGALTVVNANAFANDGAVKKLLPPGAEGAARSGGCIEGAGPKRLKRERCLHERK